jgi:hypothetical protein
MRERLARATSTLGEVLSIRLPALARARWHGTGLSAVQDNTAAIGPQDLLLFCAVDDSVACDAHFLDYYRARGIAHFLFLDVAASHGFRDLVAGAPDCSVWSARRRASDRSVHWLNHLLRVHGSDHWCLTVEPGEYLVYPHWERRTLRDLTAFLEGEQRRSMFGIRLDAYAGTEQHAPPGSDRLPGAFWFDSTGYVQAPDDRTRGVSIRGGIHRRTQFAGDPGSAPRIDRVPLVRWRWHYSYAPGMRALTKRVLNRPHADEHLSPTGCLLRRPDTAFTRRRRRSAEPVFEKSVPFTGSEQLLDLGLMCGGQWF